MNGSYVLECVCQMYQHSHGPDTDLEVWVLPPYQAIFQYQQGVLQFNLFLKLSTCGSHQSPQVKGSVPRDCYPLLPTSDVNQTSGFLPVLLTDWL